MSSPRTRLTSSDIARLAGVSVSAVSLALNQRPGLSPATRERILAVAAAHNWRPHRAARALRGDVSDVAGLVVARPAQTLGVEPFFGLLISGLQSRLSQQAMALQLLIVEDTATELATYVRWAAERRVAGTVLLDLVADDPRPEALLRLGIPAVAVGGSGSELGISNVWADDYEAMRLLGSHLVSLGHHRLGYVSGPAEFEHTRRRAEALGELGRHHALRVQTVRTDFSDAQGAAATRLLLESPERPSAVVFDSDVMAVAGLAVANEMGLGVPTALSLASFDDSTLTRITHPALTSLSRDTHELGRMAAQQLLELLRTGVPGSRQAPTPTLSVRASTAPPPR